MEIARVVKIYEFINYKIVCQNKETLYSTDRTNFAVKMKSPTNQQT